MSQHSQDIKKGRGGARIGAGNKKKDVKAISITVPEDQISDVDKLPGTRSFHYSEAMKLYLQNYKTDQQSTHSTSE